MPRKALGLRAIRTGARRTSRVPDISMSAWILGDGLTGLDGETAVAASVDEARAAWPHYRRQVWARTFVGHLPGPAETYDLMSNDGEALLRATCDHDPFPLGDVLDVLAGDRLRLDAFRQTDREGAHAIGDFLDRFAEHLDRVEAAAREVAADPATPGWRRRRPALSSARVYGDIERDDEPRRNHPRGVH